MYDRAYYKMEERNEKEAHRMNLLEIEILMEGQQNE